jgi:tetratricopeptide (TPR) repeat protein
MIWELTLRAANAPQRASCAWFVPGDSAEAWLAALAEFPIDETQARLLIVPHSATDRRPLGALVLVDTTNLPAASGKTAQQVSGDTHSSQPFVCGYGRIADRLCVPIEAVVSPPASGSELDELLADDQLYVWHPTAGLVPFTAADWLRPVELLSPPTEREARWDRAVPGVACNSRLLSLSASSTPSLTEIIEQVRGEIGSLSNELDTLPPSPREPQQGVLTSIKRGLTTACARFALWLSKLGSPNRGIAARGQGAAGSRLRRRLIALLIAGVTLGIVCLLVWFCQSVSQPRGLSSDSYSYHLPPQSILPSPHQPLGPSNVSGIGWLGPLGAFVLLIIAILAIRAAKMRGWLQLGWLLRILFVLLAAGLLLQLISSRSPATALVAIIAAIVVGILLSRLVMRLFRIGSSAADRPVTRTARPARLVADSNRGWLSRLGAWATSKLRTISASMEAARNRELERLIHLLDMDPDAGLRYALPLAGDAPRGIGAPGARLTTRTIDFGARGYGSGRADIWNMQAEYRRKLTQQYRTLANREIALGRHRRAAYILAELLGNWTGAAHTLADGGHHREAAVIYDERLKRPLEAAKCLERGGLLTEAVVVYQRLEMHETVGDLYTKLEQPSEAEQAYRRAVEQKRSAADRLGAARLLETKLRAPGEAWDELVSGWPAAPQAEQCLREAFVWTQRHGDAERARRFLRDAATRAKSSDEVLRFVGCATRVATAYPDAGVRTVGRDVVLTVVAPRLPKAAPRELAGLTAALRGLAPDDRLLSRDCDRYLRDRSTAPPPLERATRDRQLQLRRVIKLPFGNVRACVASADSFYAAGWRDQELVLIRGAWQGNVQYPDRAPWRFSQATPETPILMAVESLEEEIVCVHPFGQRPADYLYTFPPTDQLRRRVSAGPFAGISSTTVAMSAATRIYAVDRRGAEITVSTYRTPGLALVGTASCQSAELPGLQFPIPYQEREGVHYLAAGRSIGFIRGDRFMELFECDQDVVRLVASPAHTRPRLLAVMPRGAQLLWGVLRGASTSTLASDMLAPQVLLNRDGWIIAADRRGCQVFGVHRDALQLHVATEWEDRGEVVAVLPLPIPHVFAACFASGEILQYQIPSGH